MSYQIGLSFSILIASVDIKCLPEPLSKKPHNAFPCDTTGIIGGRLSSTDGENPVSSELLLPLSHKLVWCFALQ